LSDKLKFVELCKEGKTEVCRTIKISAEPKLKSLSKPNLKTKIVAILGNVAQRSLLVLGHERKLIRNPVFESQYLILIRRKIRRVCYPQIIVDLPTDRQTCRWVQLPARNVRVDFEYVQAEKPVCRPSRRIVDDGIRQNIGGRVYTGLCQCLNSGFGIR
jgi:hypothetical protein